MNSSSQVGALPRRRNLLDVVRPSFFPGQSLSDQDLTDLIQWTEQRIRLESECDDWGIVCGLHVSIDPEDAAGVLIGPGYGFNAARELCVVSKDNCRCEETPNCKCRGKTNCRKYQLPKSDCSGRCADKDQKEASFPKFTDVKTSDVFAFDLFISPEECSTGHQLTRSANGQRNCKPTRVRSSAVVSHTCNPYSQAPNAVVHCCGPSTSKVIEALRSPPVVSYPVDANGIATIRNWLQEAAKRVPSLLGINTRVLETCKGFQEDRLTQVLCQFVYFARRSCDCRRSDSNDSRIPLARVWARCAGNSFEILVIDENEPYRRTVDCHRSRFCIAEWIGRPLTAAQEAAKSSGVELEVVKLPGNLSDVLSLLEKEAACDAAVNRYEVFCVDATGERRILTYRPKPKSTSEATTPDPEVEPKSEPDPSATTESIEQGTADAQQPANQDQP